MSYSSIWLEVAEVNETPQATPSSISSFLTAVLCPPRSSFPIACQMISISAGDRWSIQLAVGDLTYVCIETAICFWIFLDIGYMASPGQRSTVCLRQIRSFIRHIWHPLLLDEGLQPSSVYAFHINKHCMTCVLHPLSAGRNLFVVQLSTIVR